MKNMTILMTLLLFLLAGCNSSSGEKGKFEIGDKTFLLNDKPFTIKAAEIHYTRIPVEYWEHRIQMCKALGMNTICIYAFWNIHEQKPGEFDFTGQNDIAAFCRLAQNTVVYHATSRSVCLLGMGNGRSPLVVAEERGHTTAYQRSVFH